MLKAIKIITILLFVQVSFAQSSLITLFDGVSYETETLAYKTRVEADGGTIIDINAVNDFYKALKSNNYQDSLVAWFEADMGVKKVGVNVSKVYDLIGTKDLTQTGTDSDKPDYYADSLGGKPTWYFDGAHFKSTLTFSSTGAHYLVYRTSIIANDEAIGTSNTSIGYVCLYQRSNGEVWNRVFNGTTTINVGLGAGAVTSSWNDFLYTGTWQIGYGSRQINNGAIATGTSAGVNPASAGNIIIGADGDGVSALFTGHISAFGVGVNNSRAAWIKTYLNNKYSIY